jgi:hypothetical protein
MPISEKLLKNPYEIEENDINNSKGSTKESSFELYE